jgi:hypothetical protein
MLSFTVVLKDKFDNSRNLVFSEVKVMAIKIISKQVPSSFMISLTLVDEPVVKQAKYHIRCLKQFSDLSCMDGI